MDIIVTSFEFHMYLGNLRKIRWDDVMVEHT